MNQTSELPTLDDLCQASIARSRRHLVELMRQKSTAELMLIQIDEDRTVWRKQGLNADDAFKAARLVARERRGNLREMTEAFEEVRKTIAQRKPPTVNPYVWLRQKLLTLKVRLLY